MGKSAPKAPNYQPMADASADNARVMADIANSDRDWSITQWNDQRALMEPVIQDQLADSAFQRDLASRMADQGFETQQHYLGMLESFNADQNAIAQGQLSLGQGQLGLQGQALGIQGRVADAQIGQMQQNMEQGADYYQNYVNTYRPVEQRVVDDAMAFNQNARFDEIARDYQSQHAQGLAQSRLAGERAQASRGVNPGSAAAQAMYQQGDIMSAASSAAGSDAARRAARAEGQGRLMEAVGIGRNQPGYSTNAYGLATNAANSASSAGAAASNAAYQQGQLALGAGQLANSNTALGLNAINSGLSAGAGLTSQGAGFFGGAQNSASAPFAWMNANNAGAMQGLSAGANSMYQGGSLQMQGLSSILDSQTSIYNNQTNANAEMMGAIVGGATGMFSFTSDIRLKENIELVGQYPNGMNQYEFNYRDDASRQRYRGVMAQEVQKTRPDAVVTDGEGYMSVIYDLLGIEMEKV